MNGKDLFNAIGDISDDLILEASNPAKKMRRVRMSRAAVIAAAVIMLFGITVYAASVIYGGISGHSSNIPTYYSVPTREALGRDIGIELNVVDVFSSGYSFKSGHIVYNEEHGDDGSVISRFRALSCKYILNDDTLSFSAEATAAAVREEETEITETYRGSGLHYDKYLNKIVPGNYELTEQDKEDEANGKYVFSFGSSGGIELKEVQIVTFEYGEISYSLCAINSVITEDGLLQMAKEIIDNQN